PSPPPQADTHHNTEEPSIPVPIESPTAFPDPSPPTPPNFASPNTQNDTRTPVPVESLMDPNFPVCDADIDAFLASIQPLTSDGPHGQWWQNRDMQIPTPPVANPPPAIIPTPPVINTPPAIAGSPIESPMQGQNSSMVNISSTPPRIRRPHLNAVPSSLSKSLRLPPVDAGDSLPVMRVSATPLPGSVTTNSHSVPPVSSTPVENVTPSPAFECSTSVDTDSHSRLPASSAYAPLTGTTLISTATDTLLPAASVPPVSTAPGRRSVRATRPSTRADDANKIGDNTISKRKRKASSITVTVKKSKK
ncbi:hypothetical protein P692DRAFT_20881266, partial [Suillus brevipes Sb2]